MTPPLLGNKHNVNAFDILFIVTGNYILFIVTGKYKSL